MIVQVVQEVTKTINNITTKDALISSLVLLMVSFFLSILSPEKENRFFLFCIYVFSEAIVPVRYLHLSGHELTDEADG